VILSVDMEQIVNIAKVFKVGKEAEIVTTSTTSCSRSITTKAQGRQIVHQYSGK
jgi:hypothetical protein